MTETLFAASPTTTGFLFVAGQPEPRILELNEFLSIGRDPSSQLQVSDPFVSARHCRIDRRDQAYVIRDLRSRNGTMVNGTLVIEARLQDGDEIQIGETKMRFSVTATPKIDENLLSSRNPNWQEQLKSLPNLAASNLSVLLTGPSGAGKDVIARALHQLSERSRGPFISVNCSALSESLIESELFGHIRGSFTGATNDRLGAFQTARGGTLFLDEIGDLPISLQPKLLRALENQEIRPVGSDRNVTTDVRIIAATHQNLREQVRRRQFREDLFFRLNVIHISVPALRDRPEDIEDLFYQFAKYHRVRFNFAAIQRLKAHTWPGNIRELRNLVARAKAYCGGQTVTAEMLETLIEAPLESAPAPANVARQPIIRELEQDLIRDRLAFHRGNQRRAAQDLGMPKSTLHDRIRLYGINIDQLLRERGIGK